MFLLYYLGADLVTTLASLNVNNFPHVGDTTTKRYKLKDSVAN